MVIRVFTQQDEVSVIALWGRCGLIRPWNDPAGDIAQCLGSESSTLFIASEGETVDGTVMVGYDGHRGWVYYLAVDAQKRRRGLGRALMKRAEAWVLEKGGRKIQAMIRSENVSVHDFYRRLSYEDGDVRLVQKWIRPYASPTQAPDETE